MTAIEIVFPFIGAGIGGSHISTLALAEELRRRGNFRCLFVSPPKTPFYDELEHRGFEVVAGPEPVAESWPAVRDLVRVLPRRDFLRNLNVGPDAIMHCNDLPTLRSWGLPARTRSMRIVYHHRSINRMRSRARLAISWADHVVCNSMSTMENVDFVPAKRRSRIWNPLPVDYDSARISVHRATLREELGLKTYSPIVGFVGNFWKRKRPIFFLDVARAMLATQPTIHFAIFGRAGDIPQEGIARAIAERGLERSVTLLGFRSPPERNIAALDLLLAPAIEEPFGRILVEALLLGVPYVATDDAGHGEIQRQWGGGIAVPKSTTALAFAEVALAAMSRSPALDASRRQEVAIELSAARHADQISAIYARILLSNKVHQTVQLNRSVAS